MKRHLEEIDQDKNEKIINFQRQDLSKEKEITIKKTNKEELDEINEILCYTLEDDDNLDIIINIDTINKIIYINEKNNNNEKNRKYKYGNKNFESLIDVIHDDFMYKDINSLSLYIDKQNLFVDKKEWKTQLYNEISYINLLKNESKKDDEFMSLLDNLKCLDLNQIKG
jgi:hypothetical protein